MKYRKCIIHIGVHKTGTTSIQESLFSNRQNLFSQSNFYYPIKSSNYTTELRSMFRLFPEKYLANIKRRIDTKEKAKLANNKYFDALEQEFEEHTGSTFILSAEGLSTFSIDEVARLKHFLSKYFSDYQIIVFAREPVSWAASAHAQSVKSGKTLQSLFDKPKGIDYKNKIEPWVQLFGITSISLMDYDLAVKHPYGVVGAFCEMCGISKKFFGSIDCVHLNKSISHIGLHLLSTLNNLRPLVVQNKISLNRMPDDWRLFTLFPGDQFTFSESQVEKIMGTSEIGVEWLRANFQFEFTSKYLPNSSVYKVSELGCVEHLVALLIDLALAGKLTEQHLSQVIEDLVCTYGQEGLLVRLSTVLESRVKALKNYKQWC